MAKLRRGDLFQVLEQFDTAGELVEFADELLRVGLVEATETYLVAEMRPGYALIAPYKFLSSPSPATSRGYGGRQ